MYKIILTTIAIIFFTACGSSTSIGIPSWSFGDSVGNQIIENSIGAGYEGRNVVAIYIAQIDSIDETPSTKTRDTLIKSNIVTTGKNLAYNLYLYENSMGGLQDVKVINNKFHKDNSFMIQSPDGEIVDISSIIVQKSGNINFQ